MDGKPSDPETPHNRGFLRVALGVLGHLETLEGRKRVEIMDLSQGGAHAVFLDEADAAKLDVNDCVLRWLGFDAFGTVTRRDGAHLAIAFDELLRPGVIKETNKQAALVVRNEFGERKLRSRLWAKGIYSA
ncbi:hypothetical protein [Qipengyuania zhejiangensis]|uniref:hypothetical protein n=1 Tax=Qipengyuania zhejiangensis TaxID=3077782 RepID=UPI002D799AA7|nr:hypothetical protein [Qipengyuania sp. Z2]